MLEQVIILRNAVGVTRLLTNAVDSTALSRLSGVEVLARGRADGATLSVIGFTVRRVDGESVVDGLIRRDGERLVLETATGRILLGNPPAVFRSMVGARVWIGGQLDTGPNVYGIIVPPPSCGRTFMRMFL